MSKEKPECFGTYPKQDNWLCRNETSKCIWFDECKEYIASKEPCHCSEEKKTGVARLKELHRECVKISESKTQDYATDEDPWKNFKSAERVGVDPFRGVLIRLLDKIGRICEIARKGYHAVGDETIYDTLKVASNYCLIAICVKEEMDDKEKEVTCVSATAKE